MKNLLIALTLLHAFNSKPSYAAAKAFKTVEIVVQHKND